MDSAKKPAISQNARMIHTLGLQNSKVLQMAKILIKHCELSLPLPDPLVE